MLLTTALVIVGFCFGGYCGQIIVEPTIVYRDSEPVIKEVEKVIIVEAPAPDPEIIIKEVKTTVYRYPNTPPYEAFADPIEFDQALVLLYGMRASHIQILNWEFESDPGFGIADKDLQRQFIKWYDQLIDIFWRMGNSKGGDA